MHTAERGRAERSADNACAGLHGRPGLRVVRPSAAPGGAPDSAAGLGGAAGLDALPALPFRPPRSTRPHASASCIFSIGLVTVSSSSCCLGVC